MSRFDDLKRIPGNEGEARLGAADIQALFGVLKREVEKERPSLEPTRQAGIDEVMSVLGDLVGSEGQEKTLDQMLADRSKLEGVARLFEAQGRRPSLKGPGAAAGSRSEKILSALQELKMFVW